MTDRDAELQRYFDGEMTDAERGAFEATISDDDRSRLEALAEMRVLLVSSLDGAGADADLWAGVEARLPAVASKPVAPVIPLPQRRRRRVAAWAAAGGVFLAAAAALIVVVSQPALKASECDVEQLEVEGSVATVLHVGEGAKGHTVIWTEED